MYEKSLRSQVLMVADRAMAFGSLIVGCAFMALCVVAGIETAAQGVWWLPLSAVAFAGAVVSLWQVGATIGAMINPKLPTAIQAALMQPRWPFGTRWIFAGWWLLHLFAGVGLAVGVLEEEPPDAGFVIFSVLASTAFTYAAYGFLMLATTSYTRDPHVIARVWGWRVGWSYFHGLIALIFGICRLAFG